MFSAEELERWSGGTWTKRPEQNIESFSFDSRVVKHGNVFIALKSETADGHNYVLKAFAAGAAGAIVCRNWNPPVGSELDIPLLKVDDPLSAMHAIAAAYRRKVNPFVIGVTGSVGKSTVKTWTAAFLEDEFRTAATIANFNNNIGLPISLTSMSDNSEKGVFEVGMNHKGELAPLCRTLAPNAGIITAIAPVHIEFFDSVAAIADEKAELLRSLPDSGFAVLDASSQWFSKLAASTRSEVITVSCGGDGLAGNVDFRAEIIDASIGKFSLSGKRVDEPLVICTWIPGEHNVLNALYAIAASRMCGVPWNKISKRAENLPMMKMRWEKTEIGGVNFVNDAYNANPVAMAASLKTFCGTVKDGRRIFVLGEMRELGSGSKRFHEEIGELVSELNPDILVAVGGAGKWMADAACASGFNRKVILADDSVAAGVLLKKELRAGDNVLLKASRGVALEKVLKNV